MKILTVRQPWAWAIIHAAKNVENRSRNIAGDYRGPVAIHAAKRADADEVRAALSSFPPVADAVRQRLHIQRLCGVGDPLYVSAIIGVVDLVDVHMECRYLSTEAPQCSPWAQHGAYHLEFTNPRALATPIPHTGALGLRTLPDDVAARVWAEVHGG